MSVIKYQWKENVRCAADAAEVGKAIDSLGKRLGKAFEGVTAEDVVAEARDDASPLHPLFTWDDSEAAELYRQEQARRVIRSIRVVYVGSSDLTPRIARVAVRPATLDGSKAERAYVPMTLAARNERLKEQMIADAIVGLNGWKRRLAELQGAEKALAHLDRAIDALAKAKAKPAEPTRPRPAAI